VKLTGELPTDLHYGDRVSIKIAIAKRWLGLSGIFCRISENWTFLYPLTGQQAENQRPRKAAKLYDLFKGNLKSFPESVPPTARMNLQGNQVYFYFFAETRFDFAEFVKGFRQEIGYNFFLYQVGARDRVRLHPNLHERF
jgi:hypothetical protein